MSIGFRRYPPIPRLEDSERCPLTFQQERVLYFCDLDPGSTIWDINTCKRLVGKVDEKRLAAAVELLFDRHDALRTRIHRDGDGPFQCFTGEARALRRLDLSETRSSQREPALAGLLTEICQRPISARIYNEPLLEVVLIKLTAGEHVLMLRCHHIIADAASLDLLWRDLRLVYSWLIQGGSGVPDQQEGIRYSDYAAWQRREFAAEATLEQEEYWLDQFKDEPPALDLPTDAAPSTERSFNGGLEIVEIPPHLIEAFQRLSWEHEVLLFSSLLSVYLVLQQKLCQQQDITVGILFSGRHYCPELNETAGFFVNTTAVRLEVLWDYSFEELVGEVQDQVEAAFYMQDYPFERLVQRLAPNRNDARVPLFRSMFNVVPATDDEELLEGIEQEHWIDVATQTNAVQVDLIFDIHWGGSAAEIRIEHNTDIFHKATVVRLAGHYVTLLQQLQSGWASSLRDLELVNDNERHQLLEQWSPDPIRFPRDRCVHELFSDQVAARPDELAIVDGEHELSYAETDARAESAARLLRSFGVGPESIVAVVGGRTAEMVLGLLATLKAGGAYLPIPRSCPSQRLHETLEDARPRALILPSDYHDDVSFAGKVLRLSDDMAAGTETSADTGSETAQPGPESLACVIYTSGSTGSPKGVMVEHHSIVNLVTCADYIGLSPGDRLLQTGAPGFDATTFEIWGALLNGLRLYTVDDETLVDADAVKRVLAEKRIDIMFMIPPLLNQLAEVDAGMFRPLRCLVTGGEVLSTKHIELIRQANPELRVINAYGPTENTTFSTYHTLHGPEPRSIPIGRPIPNSRAYIVDRDNNLSPVGAIGELLVGGEGLARGYLHRPGLTRERFIDDPFSSGQRAYRTGDLARWRRDGALEFHGRTDRQVKVRGFRIELGEIENRLLEHELMKEVAVTPAVNDDGGTYLCAFYVAAKELPAQELRTHISALLPSYMHPSCYCQLSEMPLTSSGKIDLRALPTPQLEPEPDVDRAAPQGATEIRIARIWEELLGISSVSANDNFFQIGGHSLKAGTLATRLTEELGVEMSLRSIFDMPTVAELALMVDDQDHPERIDGRSS